MANRKPDQHHHSNPGESQKCNGFQHIELIRFIISINKNCHQYKLELLLAFGSKNKPLLPVHAIRLQCQMVVAMLIRP